MKLSTRGRYGLKAMVSLAERHGEGPVSTAALSEAQGVSFAYLEQLMAALKKAELVHASRGAQGGYTLTRAPGEINVGEVLAALEGSTALVDCVGYEAHSCENACSCAARPLWLKLQSRINAVLEETTIQDLAEDYVQQKERMKQ